MRWSIAPTDEFVDVWIPHAFRRWSIHFPVSSLFPTTTSSTPEGALPTALAAEPDGRRRASILRSSVSPEPTAVGLAADRQTRRYPAAGRSVHSEIGLPERPLNSKESGEVRRRGDSGRSAGNPDGRSLGLRPLTVVAKSPQDREHGLGAGAVVEFVRVIALVE
jgi:hypothetical protein